MKLKNNYIEMEMKRNWNSPVKAVQQFVPQEYGMFPRDGQLNAHDAQGFEQKCPQL